MRKLIILSKEDIEALKNDDYVALKAEDGTTIVIMSDESYKEYLKNGDA